MGCSSRFGNSPESLGSPQQDALQVLGIAQSSGSPWRDSPQGLGTSQRAQGGLEAPLAVGSSVCCVGTLQIPALLPCPWALPAVFVLLYKATNPAGSRRCVRDERRVLQVSPCCWRCLKCSCALAVLTVAGGTALPLWAHTRSLWLWQGRKRGRGLVQ